MIASTLRDGRHTFCHALFVLTVLVPALAPAQQPAPSCTSPDLTAIDVASVKPIQQSANDFSMYNRPDSLKADGILSNMIEFAYSLHDFQISGGPGWLTTATWEVAAKVDQPPANYDSLPIEVRGALQRRRMAAVLAQRFNLKCHFETKQLPVYNLVLTKGGAKPALAPTSADAAKKGSFSVHGDERGVRMQANGVAIDTLVANLSGSLGRTVINHTGLTGIYDFTLTYAPNATAASPASADDAAGPTIFTALEEQLGLRLEPAKGPVPVLIIDSISRPSEN
jgi:uncharacterized protein (TIGR03435 family)